MTSKRQFQQLADMHAADAMMLFRAQRHVNAVHLAGIGVECALKALVCEHFHNEVLPDPKIVQRAHSHVLADLVGLAGIKPHLDQRAEQDAEFDARWSIMRTWSVAVRYETVSEAEAVELLDAAIGEEGLLQWIKTFW